MHILFYFIKELLYNKIKFLLHVHVTDNQYIARAVPVDLTKLTDSILHVLPFYLLISKKIKMDTLS